MTTTPSGREVVLWGIGHTNAHALRMWRTKPIRDARLTCVSNAPISTYSGMLPGVLAGPYPRERMEIDLARLCAAAGARLIVGAVTGLDLAARELVLEDRPRIPFDVLSIGIGSVPSTEGVTVTGASMVPVKPMTTFLDRLAARLREAAPRATGRPLRIAVVGGGAGGVEIAFCLAPFVARTLGPVDLELRLIHAGDHLAAGRLPRTNHRIARRLAERGIGLHLGRRVSRVQPGFLILGDGAQIAADVVVWTTGAAAPPVLMNLGLPTDERGFLQTRPTLRTVADAPIFVVGDSGSIRGSPLPRAGVFAVRQGPVLWRNLARMLDGRDLEPYRPQRRFLRLLNTGDGRAIGEYGSTCFEGRWCLKLKDFIDGRFMDRYQK